MKPETALLRRIPALRTHLGVCVAVALATAAAVVAQAESVATGVARLVAGDRAAVTPLVVALIIVGVVRAGSRWVLERSATRAMQRTRCQVSGLVVDHLEHLDEAGRAHVRPAAVTALGTTGVDALEPWIREYLPAVCLAAVVPLTAGLTILVTDVISAVILLVAIPLIPVFMVLIGRLTDERSQRQWAALQRLGAHFHDVLIGLETLRIFGRAEEQVRRVREVTDQYRRAVMRTLRVAFLSALVLELISTLSVALVAVAIGVRLDNGTVSLRTALIVLLLAPECSLPLRRLGAAYHAAIAGADAATELGQFEGLSQVPDGPLELLPSADLVVSGLVIDDPERGRRVGPVDLVAEAGEVVALRGPSGSGKSTLFAAIAGNIPVTDGTVLLGGTVVEHWSRSSLRSALAVVSQHPDALGPSVAESVTLGNGPVSPVRLHAALAALEIDELAARPPGELSGGERQRVAVARAALAVEVRGARLVLADEPTAHLDRHRADLVMACLRDCAARGAAVLIVTHDTEVAARADRVVELRSPDTEVASAAGPAMLPPESGGRAEPADDVPAPAPVSVSGPVGGGRWNDLMWARRIAPTARGRLSGARALGTAADACAIGLAGTSAWLILRAAEHPSFASLVVAAVAIRACALGKGVLRYFERLTSHDATLRQLGEIRGVVIERLGRLVPAGVPNVDRGQLMSSVVDDVDRLGDLELRVVGPALSAAVVAIGAMTVLSVLAGTTAVPLAAGSVVAAVLLPAWVARRSEATGPGLVDAKSAVSSSLLDLAERAEEVASLGAVGPWRAAIDASVAEVVRWEGRRGSVTALASAAIAGLGPWVAAATVALLGASSGRPGPVVGLAVLLPFALFELFVPAPGGAELASTVAASASRLRSLIVRPDPLPEPVVPRQLEASERIEMDDVSLAWPGGPVVVAGLDLDLPEGRRIAIEGPSGSGKSTIAAALVNFVLPLAGSYRLGGISVTALGGRNVRRTVGWLGQDSWLADTSIRENLRIADPDVSTAEMIAALERVRLWGWVASLPDGLDTLLGLGGVGASGGQCQRIALARILLSRHQAVILDEPFSHVDGDTAAQMMPDLLTAFGHRTMVLIGHDNGGFDVDDTLDLSLPSPGVSRVNGSPHGFGTRAAAPR